MRLLVAALTSLLAVSLAAAQSPQKDSAKGDAMPAAPSTEPKRVKTVPVDADGQGKAGAKSETKAEAKDQPASKAQPKGKEATKAKAESKGAAKSDKGEKPEKVSKEIIDSYAAIPLAERVAIQNDLIWTGDYNGVLNGE